ncbi:MAG: magnesium transporter [Chthoniobacter sp.]|jgi:magnesium transporter|nr:magnesium transporter [Chthoniobacter sp.]
MTGHLIEPAIKALIDTRDFTALRKVFEEWTPAEIAECIVDFPPDEQAVVFRMLPQDKAAGVLEYLDHGAQCIVLKAMGSEAAARVLNDMSPDDRTRLLEELPPAAVTHTLSLLTPEERKIAQALLNYPEGSIGRLMTPHFVAVGDDWTILQVLEHFRKHGQDSETLNVIYVLDERGTLIDDVRIRELLLKPFETKICEIRDDRYVALSATDPAVDAAQVFKKYDRNTLPVVDSADRLIGIVTIDDVLDVLEAETTREVQKIGGLEALDEPYTTISLPRMIKKRATWLIILFLSEMLTATAMGHFEDEISKAVVLAVFLPLIISSGGNSGSQATTLIIRAMAVGEVSLRDWWHVLRRELGAGLWLGLILGTIGFCRIMLWQTLHFQDYGAHYLLVALTVGLSLIGVVLWGSVSGSMLPFFLRRVGLDPATSSAPFVATLVDVTGLVIYFNVAFVVLRGTVL